MHGSIIVHTSKCMWSDFTTRFMTISVHTKRMHDCVRGCWRLHPVHAGVCASACLSVFFSYLRSYQHTHPHLLTNPYEHACMHPSVNLFNTLHACLHTTCTRTSHYARSDGGRGRKAAGGAGTRCNGGRSPGCSCQNDRYSCFPTKHHSRRHRIGCRLSLSLSLCLSLSLSLSSSLCCTRPV